MDTHKNISFENIIKEYENNSKGKKQNQRMKKLANIKETKISPLIIKGIEEFRHLVNQIKNEAKGRRRLFL
jgi:FKBP-type peptidyl-prolyl cis-trans isomerase (trigger factor)